MPNKLVESLCSRRRAYRRDERIQLCRRRLLFGYRRGGRLGAGDEGGADEDGRGMGGVDYRVGRLVEDFSFFENMQLS